MVVNLAEREYWPTAGVPKLGNQSWGTRGGGGGERNERRSLWVASSKIMRPRIMNDRNCNRWPGNENTCMYFYAIPPFCAKYICLKLSVLLCEETEIPRRSHDCFFRYSEVFWGLYIWSSIFKEKFNFYFIYLLFQLASRASVVFSL